ncbi:hypothetical protein A0123_02933 [Gluconobacter cerinus]|uniref:Uncharacterized protein n=1 Tax=Gluconobacter cerinus TaxID=38307 RepID=A0A1B6VGR6_9PROT|nr:hypothetical protein A0123_02933 [Gluconobacter cerinus]
MIPIWLRRLYFLLWYLTGFPRDFRPGVQGFIPFSTKDIAEVGVRSAIGQHPLCGWGELSRMAAIPMTDRIASLFMMSMMQPVFSDTALSV